jgi:hypothetical protein
MKSCLNTESTQTVVAPKYLDSELLAITIMKLNTLLPSDVFNTLRDLQISV